MNDADGWNARSARWGTDDVVRDPTLSEAILEQAPDAVIFADREGLIRLWNQSAAALFGYAAAEVLGRSLDVIIPERLRNAHWQGYRKATETGVMKYAGTRADHALGSQGRPKSLCGFELRGGEGWSRPCYRRTRDRPRLHGEIPVAEGGRSACEAVRRRQ